MKIGFVFYALHREAALTQMKEIYSSINVSLKLTSLGFAKGW